MPARLDPRRPGMLACGMRLFVALDLSWGVREQLAGLAMGLAGLRWVPPENYHITLRFIGDVPRHVAEDIDLALAGVQGRGFSIELAGVGTHEKAGRISALWVGVTRSQALEHLRGKLETALQRAGVAPERRRFLPHVTLARLSEASFADAGGEQHLAAWVQAHNLFRSAPIRVDQFGLFSSRLGREQSVYTQEVEYPLA